MADDSDSVRLLADSNSRRRSTYEPIDEIPLPLPKDGHPHIQASKAAWQAHDSQGVAELAQRVAELAVRLSRLERLFLADDGLDETRRPIPPVNQPGAEPHRVQLVDTPNVGSAVDPYRDWLGLPDGARPPDHYTLLGVKAFESDLHALRNASTARYGRVKAYVMGQYGTLAQRLLGEIGQATACLLDDKARRAYDESLRRTPGR